MHHLVVTTVCRFTPDNGLASLDLTALLHHYDVLDHLTATPLNHRVLVLL